MNGIDDSDYCWMNGTNENVNKNELKWNKPILWITVIHFASKKFNLIEIAIFFHNKEAEKK